MDIETKTSTHCVAYYNDNAVFRFGWTLYITGPVYKNAFESAAYVGLISADQIDEAMVKADAKVEAFIADDTLMLSRTVFKKDVI